MTRTLALALLLTTLPALAQAPADLPKPVEDGGPRTFVVANTSRRVNLREERSTTSRSLASYAAGALLANLGDCRVAGGRAWCDVQPLGGGPRGYVAAEFLATATGPDGAPAVGPDDSALRAGEGRFDATGRIPCAQDAGQPMTDCELGVARAGGGYATVVVKRPGNRTRAVFFRLGRPIGADTSEAEGDKPFRATKEQDLNLIRVGDERYEIPDAVVLGG
jgi:hypothetical protein